MVNNNDDDDNNNNNDDNNDDDDDDEQTSKQKQNKTKQNVQFILACVKYRHVENVISTFNGSFLYKN